MKSGISNVRVQAQIFFDSNDLEKLRIVGMRNWEIANACFAGEKRQEWAEFFRVLGHHASKCGAQAGEAAKELLKQYGTEEAMEALEKTE